MGGDAGDARRGTVGKQEFGAWRGLEKTNREFTPHAAKRKTGASHTLRCEGTKIYSDEIVENRFRDTGADIPLTMTTGYKNKDH